jgi:hypothetical protein
MQIFENIAAFFLMLAEIISIMYVELCLFAASESDRLYRLLIPKIFGERIDNT